MAMKKLVMSFQAALMIWCLASQVRGAPTFEGTKDLDSLVKAVSEDLSGVAMAKAAALGFAGGMTVKDGTGQLLKLVEDTGNAALKSASEVGDLVADIDVIQALNDTEANLIEKKVSVIRGLFDAKRRLISNLREIIKEHSASASTFYAKTLEGINAAIASTQKGIEAAKQSASKVAAKLTVENAQAQIDNAQSVVLGAVEATVSTVEQTSSSLLNALVKAKADLQEAAEQFDSKRVATQAKDKVGEVVKLGALEADKLVEQVGLYEAVDDLVHSLSDLPTKINSILKEASKEVQIELTLAPGSAGPKEKAGSEDAEIEPEVVNFRSLNDETVAVNPEE